jgi:hypothetical protein
MKRVSEIKVTSTYTPSTAETTELGFIRTRLDGLSAEHQELAAKLAGGPAKGGGADPWQTYVDYVHTMPAGTLKDQAELLSRNRNGDPVAILRDLKKKMGQ